jgi:cell division protein FtsI/penicillin-binding protein 2
LSLVSYRGPGIPPVQFKEEGPDHLCLRATFPSASVFKVVTAAAAIAEKNFSADSVLSFNGRNHTLYKSQVLKDHQNKWTRQVTLRSAFANSINTVFGRMGAFTVGSENLKTYASRFGFNRKISGDLPIQPGKAKLEGSDWELAEAASGFTKENRMSPLQGALIVAAIVNDGMMMEPWLISSLHSSDGTKLYEALPKVASEKIDLKTTRELKELMRATVEEGTSRSSFRGFFKNKGQGIDVGGKTGSLTGDEPPGKYDWFVGFADSGSERIAIAALTIHEKYWRVKSSYVARKAFEYYFSK